MQLGEQVKGTACAEGRPDPGEEEQLGFAVDGKVCKCHSERSEYNGSRWQAELFCNGPEGVSNKIDLFLLQLVQDAGAKICVYVYDTHWVRSRICLSLYLYTPLHDNACLARHVWLIGVMLPQVNQSDSSLWAADPLGHSSQPLPQVCRCCAELALYWPSNMASCMHV